MIWSSLRSSQAKSRSAGTDSSRSPLDFARDERVLALTAAALLLSGAAPVSVVDAERDFARRAQVEGMWTAFRATAAPDALLFVPSHVNAQEWLKGRADPPIAPMWWPAKVTLSCDGLLAHSSGPTLRDGGRTRGYYSTIWRRSSDGEWRWTYDHGATTNNPGTPGDRPEIKRASCDNLGAARVAADEIRALLADPKVQMLNKPVGLGASPDGSLVWTVTTTGKQIPGLKQPFYEATVLRWNGSKHEWAHKDFINFPDTSG